MGRMAPKRDETVLPERIEAAIYLIRKEKVILDHDLASLYGVSTKALVQAVKRNIERFPQDFMFRLSAEEFAETRLTRLPSRGWLCCRVCCGANVR